LEDGGQHNLEGFTSIHPWERKEDRDNELQNVPEPAALEHRKGADKLVTTNNSHDSRSILKLIIFNEDEPDLV